jgi:hypothetical protein
VETPNQVLKLLISFSKYYILLQLIKQSELVAGLAAKVPFENGEEINANSVPATILK